MPTFLPSSTRWPLTTCQFNLPAVLLCTAPQVQFLQREAELAEATSAAESSSKSWKQEQAHLQEAADEWREKALELQEEVSQLGMQVLQLHTVQ